MKRICEFAFFVLLLTAAVSAVTARADTLNFALSQPNQILPMNTGGVLSFVGTISAPTSNTGLLYLNGDDFSLSGSSLTLDDNSFFNNAPLDLAPGGSYTGLLFAVDVLSDAPLTTYLGSFSILGGPDDNSYNTLATQAFSIQVTPEPSSWLLLLTGLSGAALVFRRRSLTALHH